MSDYDAPNFDAYEHFSPKRNAGKDFDKARDWVSQQEKLLNGEQKKHYERLKVKQSNELTKLNKELDPQGFEKKRSQPKPRLIPDSQRLRTNKSKIEVIKIEAAKKATVDLKMQHENQRTKFLKAVETQRAQEKTKDNTKENSGDNTKSFARAKAFDAVKQNQNERSNDNKKDKNKGYSR